VTARDNRRLPAGIHAEREQPRKVVIPRRDDVKHRRHEGLLARRIGQMGHEVQVTKPDRPAIARGERFRAVSHQVIFPV
jgi:hypothetical protein